MSRKAKNNTIPFESRLTIKIAFQNFNKQFVTVLKTLQYNIHCHVIFVLNKVYIYIKCTKKFVISDWH